ncbi:LD-carboxypeptidase [bacterium]|nr:MAG: LD-carboxypeptidase [bacterium]
MFSEFEIPDIKLKPLPKNGTIAITCPASTPNSEKLEKGVAYLENRGYTVVIGDTCYAKQDYTAGDEPMRANELLDFIDDDSVNAIFCARGGFGSMKLLRMLDYELVKEKRKLITGFSDLTALLWGIYTQTGVPSISGMLPAVDFCSADIPTQFENQFWELINTGHFRTELNVSPVFFNEKVLSEVEGVIFPGTLSLISKLIGSPYLPDTQNGILMLEDIGEPIHKVDGYLEHLSLSGMLSSSKAVCLGAFSPAEKEEYDEVPSWQTMFQRVFRSIPTPAITGFPYGHIPAKLSLPLGVPVRVSFDSKITIETLSPLFES